LIRGPLGEFEPQALLSTNLGHTPLQILSWFVRRRRMEVTFEEARAHLGVTTPPAKAGGFFWKTSFNSGFLRNA
jgi:hypothetical protein